MKKKFTLILLTLVFFACNHSDDDRRLDEDAMFLPTILSRDNQILTLTFDSQARIVQLGDVGDNGNYARLFTFIYSGGKLVAADAVYFSVVVAGGYNYTERFNFEYVQDKVLVEKIFLDSSGFENVTTNTLYVDQNGNLLKADGIEAFYDERGNMIKVINNGNVTEVSYDNMKGAFVNVETPQWALYYVMQVGNFYRVNNPIEVKGYPVEMNTEILVQREFTYNNHGFPVGFIQKTTESDGSVLVDDFFIDYLMLYHD